MSRWNESDAPRGDAYAERFRRLAASGQDVHGEADLVASYEPMTVLDAGCGTGRVAIELARRGVDVVGVDLDPQMLATARRDHPDGTWLEADLKTLALTDRTFDIVVLPGNVMIFLAPGTEAEVIARLATHLAPGGRLIAGFQLKPGGFPLEDYDQACTSAALALEDRWSTWDRAPFAPGGDYAVSVHRRQ